MLGRKIKKFVQKTLNPIFFHFQFWV